MRSPNSRVTSIHQTTAPPNPRVTSIPPTTISLSPRVTSVPQTTGCPPIPGRSGEGGLREAGSHQPYPPLQHNSHPGREGGIPQPPPHGADGGFPIKSAGGVTHPRAAPSNGGCAPPWAAPEGAERSRAELSRAEPSPAASCFPRRPPAAPRAARLERDSPGAGPGRAGQGGGGGGHRQRTGVPSRDAGLGEEQPTRDHPPDLAAIGVHTVRGVKS